MTNWKVLLFGASGSIGQAIRIRLEASGTRVVPVGRAAGADATLLAWDPLGTAKVVPEALLRAGPFDAVCWAQGANLNDSIRDVDLDRHRALYEANVVFILASLQALLAHDLLPQGTRLCIISSIWQDLGRQNKLSYGVSKSALRGLVLSLANDLGAEGFLVNAVLPGAIDTPMTRANLSAAQLAVIEGATQHHRLSHLRDVASIAQFLCSAENTGVTAQFIKADLGFSDVRII